MAQKKLKGVEIICQRKIFNATFYDCVMENNDISINHNLKQCESTNQILWLNKVNEPRVMLKILRCLYKCVIDTVLEYPQPLSRLYKV